MRLGVQWGLSLSVWIFYARTKLCLSQRCLVLWMLETREKPQLPPEQVLGQYFTALPGARRQKKGRGGCVEFVELESGQTVPIWGKTRGMLLGTGLGWTGHPGAQPLDSLCLFLIHCRYIYIPQGFLWIIRCLFCFQLERPFRGQVPFTIHLTAVDLMNVVYKGGKNGVGAWSWLTAAVNLTQALKRNNEWWGRCSPILSLSVEAFQLVNSALTFFMCCWKANTWFCSMKTSWNRCQMKPD